MSFNNTLGRIRRSRSASHAWIDLHRLVESFSVLCGQRFDEVFYGLEREHGFHRYPGRWPALPTIRAAAETLAAARAERLRALALWIAEAKARKRAGRRTDPPAELQEHERAAREVSHRRPRLGPWGWKRQRGAT
ncbi:MAG: hypothetical protein U1A78_03795 [Polyangia bacterium]